MSKIVENFEHLLKEKKIPLSKTNIESGHHLYRVEFKVSPEKKVLVEIIIQDSEDDYVDAQIIYRKLHHLNDRAKENEALALVNELNEVKAGYYTLYLAGDGEIFLKSLMRASADPEPIYQTLIVGSNISRVIVPELDKALN